MLVDLFKETVKFLEKKGYSFEDIHYVANRGHTVFMDSERFKNMVSGIKYQNVVKNIDYTSVAPDIMVHLKDGSFLQRGFRDVGGNSVECWEFRKIEDMDQISGVFCRVAFSDNSVPDFEFKDRIPEDDLDFSIEKAYEDKSDIDAEEPSVQAAFVCNLEEVSQHSKVVNMVHGGKNLKITKSVKRGSKVII